MKLYNKPPVRIKTAFGGFLNGLNAPDSSFRERIEQAIAKQKRKIAAWTELADQGEFSEQSVDLELDSLTMLALACCEQPEGSGCL